MLYEQNWGFDTTTRTITATGNSANVTDVGSAQRIFDGTGSPAYLTGWVNANSGSNVTFRCQLIGADDAALSTNPITIADTGVSEVLTTNVPRPFSICPAFQQTAKRFYGLVWTLAGTTPNVDVVAGVTSRPGQGAMPARKAAVP